MALKNCVELLKELNPGINQKRIDALEKKIGAKLPGDFISFYKIHNGQKAHGDYDCLNLRSSCLLKELQRFGDFWNTR